MAGATDFIRDVGEISFITVILRLMEEITDSLPSVIHESWHSHIAPLFTNEKMKLIKYQILTKVKFYPHGQDIFNVFKMPLDRIKVVCLGQDPYNHGEAIGYAFAVNPTTKIPGSLRVIRDEIINSKVERDLSVNIESDAWKPLVHWRRQGVFLLNAALTVEVGKPNSHWNYWNWFTKEIVHIISYKTSEKPVWLLWGSKAKSFKAKIFAIEPPPKSKVRAEANYVLEADHPAAELYADSQYKFTGCNHFNICNEILKKKNATPINW